MKGCLFQRMACALALAGALAAPGCRGTPDEPVETRFPMMGSEASVKVPYAERAKLTEYAGIACGVMQRLEAQLSIFSPTSEISLVNAAAGKESVTVSPDTLAVLRLACEYGDRSGGGFDVTVGPLMHLWGFRGGHPIRQVPSGEEIEAAKVRTGYRHIVLGEGTALLDAAGVQIDLGGIAKGYAVDRAWEELVRHGATNFLVNLGGNMRCRGQAGGRPWRVGVRNPFDRAEVLGRLTLADGSAVATSGNYERFVTVGGRRYAHIMDPTTGRPVEGMAGVTVVCPTAVAADALSTTLFVVGMEKGIGILRDLPGSEALFVPDRQPLELHGTDGFAAVFEPDGTLQRLAQ